LRVGFISTAATTRFLPNMISRFRADHPQIELTLQNMPTTDQINEVLGMGIDVAFLRMPLTAPDNLELLPVYREPHAVLLPATDPLAANDVVRPRDLRGRPLLMYSRQFAPGYHDFLLRVLNQHGLNLDIAQEAGEMYTLASLVSAGVGITIAPISTQNYHLPGVVVKPCRWLPPADIAIGFRRDNAQPACRMFIDLAIGMRNMSINMPNITIAGDS
jgi:DNA-binding transcriptional LysR family regulator